MQAHGVERPIWGQVPSTQEHIYIIIYSRKKRKKKDQFSKKKKKKAHIENI